MLTQTSLYALRALAYLVEHRDHEPILAREIDQATGVPGNYLSKIMHALGTAGLLSAERGKHGGYRLARDPAQIRVLDVVTLFQNVDQMRRCVLGKAFCSDEDPCRIHHQWKPVADSMFRFLEHTTLADLRGELLLV